jgi:hypothetical protein
MGLSPFEGQRLGVVSIGALLTIAAPRELILRSMTECMSDESDYCTK